MTFTIEDPVENLYCELPTHIYHLISMKDCYSNSPTWSPGGVPSSPSSPLTTATTNFTTTSNSPVSHKDKKVKKKYDDSMRCAVLQI